MEAINGLHLLDNVFCYIIFQSLYYNDGGCEFVRTSKNTYNAWRRYLPTGSWTLHLSWPSRRCFIRYPTHVVHVRILYPNLWIGVLSLLNESLLSLRNVRYLNTLTLQFAVVRECALEQLTNNLLKIIMFTSPEALQLFTLRLHFKLGIYPSEGGADAYRSMAWQQSALVVLLCTLWCRFSINIECLYCGSRIYEADVVRESGM